MASIQYTSCQCIKVKEDSRNYVTKCSNAFKLSTKSKDITNDEELGAPVRCISSKFRQTYASPNKKLKTSEPATYFNYRN